MDTRFTARKAARAATVAIAVSMLAFAGCKSTTTEEAPPPPKPSSEFDQGETPAVVEVVEVVDVELESIYFDFDKYEIRPEGRQALRASAGTLQASNSRVTIEGHADERGDEEYNLALGERRANVARKYLMSLGVPGNQLRTVSYGESRPAVKGSGESAWKWNRRDVFRID